MDNLTLYRPSFKQERRLLRTADTDYSTYYAFPTLLRMGGKVLVTYKAGEKHWGDASAALNAILIDADSQQVSAQTTIFSKPGFTPQMGETVRMPNGDVVVYIDMQQSLTNHRTGLFELRSLDGGKTFPLQHPVGIVDGVEYGYAMDMVTRENTVYLLAMTFPYLTGSDARQVHLLKSNDNGIVWKFCANLTKTFGFCFNECALLKTAEGFLVFTRGETDRENRKNSADDFEAGQYLVVLDEKYQVLRMRDYSHTTSFFTLTGRPRLYRIAGALYLFTRQWNENKEKRMMSLDAFRIDPCTMEIKARIRLDAPRFEHQDGHYPVVYTENDRLHVVTYITCDKDERETFTQKCDLVQLSYHLDEVAQWGKEG